MAFWDGHRWIRLGAETTETRNERARFLVVILATLALLSVVLTVSLPAHAAGPALSVDGAAVAAAPLGVSGTGFAPNIHVQLTWDGAADGLPGVHVQHNGDFSTSITVPASTTQGAHVLAAESVARGNGGKTGPGQVLASVTVTVVDSPATPTPTPTGATPSVSQTASPTAGATASPTATAGGGSSSLALPVRAAFYYPWFPEAWKQQGMDPFTHYTPQLGYYDSSSTSVIKQHVAWMQSAGIQAGIASWWGQGSATDGRIGLLLANAGSFRWTIYYEPEGQGDPSSTQIGNDLAYLETHFTASPAWLHVNGKPVIFVYGGAETCAMADRWAAAPHRSDFYVVLKVFVGYRTCANQPDSWHQYAPAVAEDHQSGYSFTISPGFWKANESTPRLTRDLARWTTNVHDMVASGEPWQLVTTFNEWGEGTAVEPASAWGSAYLDALAGQAATTASPAPTPSPTPRPTPTPTPRPTPTPTPRPTPTPTPTLTPAASGGAIRHVIVVWLENEESTGVTSSSMPYLYGLGKTYGVSTQFYGVSHPSLPNYLALWSGSTQGVTDDNVHNISATSLSNQFASAGLSWRAYMQDYPTSSGCHTGSSYSGGVDLVGVAGTYVRRHDPPMSFTSVSGSSQCGNIQPLAKFDPNVSFAFVAPNLCNDAHDCSLGTADAFLQGFLPHVFNAPDWAHTLLVVSFDEGSSGTNGGGHIYTMVARAGLHGFSSSVVHNHYGMLRTVEDIFGLPCLRNACSATALDEFLP